MSNYYEMIGHLEDIKKRRENTVSQIKSHCESIERAVSVLYEPEQINGEYIMQLAIALNEKCRELEGYNKKIAVLNRATGK